MTDEDDDIVEELHLRDFPGRRLTIRFPASARGSLIRTDIHRPEGTSGVLMFNDEPGAYIGNASGTISGTFSCVMLELLESARGLGWLRDLRPDDVDVLSAGESRIPPAELAHVGHLSGLKELRLEGAGVTDASMRHLAPLTALRSLLLTHAAISGPGLAHLAGMTELAYLDLSWTRLTESGLQALPTLPKLRYLDVRFTAVRDIGAALRSRLPALQELRVEPVPRPKPRGGPKKRVP